MSFLTSIGDKMRLIGPVPIVALAGGLGLLAVLWVNRRKITNTVRNMVNNSYFTISELCHSATATARGIDNTPTEAVKNNLQGLITNVLDPLREAYGKPIVVNSGYRSPALNKAVGGVPDSQHLTGMAADLRGEKNTKAELAEMCRRAISLGVYDQLIFEHSGNSLWLHISYNPRGNRRQLLSYKGGRYTSLPTSGWESFV